MKNITLPIILIFICLCLTGCSKNKLFDESVNTTSINKIQVVSAMANPKLGADSKIITDKSEVEEFINLFNNATVGKKVEQENIADAFCSRYIFFENNKRIAEYDFNGNNTDKAFVNGDYHYIKYGNSKNTPYDLYEKSKSKIITVDENLNEIGK